MMKTSSVAANGIRFALLEEGSGPLVLFLHGFPDTAHTWDDVLPRVARKGYRVVAPFTRGYRPTEVGDHDADQLTLAHDALALIEALGEKQAIVVGHDWGASTAYAAAAVDGARVTKLFAIGIPHPGALKLTPAKIWGVRHFALYKLPGAAKRFAANDFAALREVYKRWSPTWEPPDAELAAVRECFGDPASCNAAFGYYRMLKFSPEPYMRKRIEVPTVVFSGTDDPIVSRSDYDHAARMFTGGYTVEEIPGGHFMHREHPDVFAQRLLAYL